MIRILLFLVLCVSALAQPMTVNDSAFVGSLTVGPLPFTPTNLAGTVFAFDANTATFVGGTSCVSWADSFSSGWSLTNVNQYAKGPSSNNLNGNTILSFSTAVKWLQNDAVTNTQPCEYWMVMKPTGTTNGVLQPFFVGGTAGQQIFDKHNVSTNPISIFSGSTVYGYPIEPLLNTWIIWTVVFNGASSSILTNNVVMKAGNAGSANLSGLVISGTYAHGASTYPGMDLAYFVGYSVTNSGADRLKLYQYFTNRFGVGGF